MCSVIPFTDSLCEHVFDRTVAIRRQAVDKAGMVRSDTQTKNLTNNLTYGPLLGQFLPNKLCSCRGMIYLALKPTCIDVIIFVRVNQTTSGSKLTLKLAAVFAQIMKQPQKLALLVQPELRGKRPSYIGDPQQVRFEALCCPIPVPSVGNIGHGYCVSFCSNRFNPFAMNMYLTSGSLSQQFHSIAPLLAHWMS